MAKVNLKCTKMMSPNGTHKNNGPGGIAGPTKQMKH